MAQFCKDGKIISGQVVTVNDDSFAVSLFDPMDTGNNPDELEVTSTRNPGVTPFQGKLTTGNAPTSGREWILKGISGISSRIDAVPKGGGASRDSFFVRFQTKTLKPPIFVMAIEGIPNWSGATRHLIPITIGVSKIIDWMSFPSIALPVVPFPLHGMLGPRLVLSPPKELNFLDAPAQKARKGVFSVTQGSFTRAVLLLLPESGSPDTVLIGVEPTISQDAPTFQPLDWTDPLSAKLINHFADRCLVNNWGRQMLASKKKMALLMPVRAKEGASELGPLVTDGTLLQQVVESIAMLVGGAFSAAQAEGFSFSNGIAECNQLLAGLTRLIPVKAVYNLDPSLGTQAVRIPGAVLQQFLTGATTLQQQRAGFMFLPPSVWVNEFQFQFDHIDREPVDSPKAKEYLHNTAARKFLLHLGIQLS
jgi:hypothetical protein